MTSESESIPKAGRDEFVFFDGKLKNLKVLQEKSNINVLLLGETGVGKSTFINAFFNYVTFPSLSEAAKEKLQVVIPAQFTVTDDNYEEQLVQVGEEFNENFEIGALGTQACCSYVFPDPGSGVKIRLIDTPGIGDPRGIDYDYVNFENILSFIGELQHLNAVCILLKPNQSRSTKMFKFCIEQLLSKLDKTDNQNLMFVFTNTRSTCYRPGETLSILKKLFSTMKGNILCDRKNIFCTDSESFRFLAASKNNIEFTTDDVEGISQSWTQSYNECLRMIGYIVGDDTNTGLTPHDVENIRSINEARRLIVQLSQPLAEITELVQDNIRAIYKHQAVLREIQSKLYIPVLDLKVKKLDEPITVCTSTKCSTVYQVGDKKKWQHSKKCHNVPNEMSQGVCVNCPCRYQAHMRIHYETETFENQLKDMQIKAAEEQAQESVYNFTLTLFERLSRLHEEKEIIMKTAAKLACFLKTNAISPYKDAYETYWKCLIDREKSSKLACDIELIQQMERILDEYVQEKQTILDAMAQSDLNNTVIVANDIVESVNLLHSLQIFGSKIKELSEAQNISRKNENTIKTKEIVVEYFKAENLRNGQASSSQPEPPIVQRHATPFLYADMTPGVNHPNDQTANPNLNSSSYSMASTPNTPPIPDHSTPSLVDINAQSTDYLTGTNTEPQNQAMEEEEVKVQSCQVGDEKYICTTSESSVSEEEFFDSTG